jgi:membrane protein DedA with SNARE-associated domain
MVDASPWMSSFYELVNAYGLWVLFIGITLECAGIPVPGETMLISVALYAGSTQKMTIGWILLVAATAATFGGMIGYITGRWIGLRLLVHYGKYVGLDEPRLKVGQYLFLRHGGKIVFFGRFVDLLRILAAALAGALFDLQPSAYRPSAREVGSGPGCLIAVVRRSANRSLYKIDRFASCVSVLCKALNQA